MTNIQKLTKTINFILTNGRSIKDFVIIDDLPYKVIGYFHDYHKGTYEVTEKQAITDDQASDYLSCPWIINAINDILIEKEQFAAKQIRLANFYDQSEF